MVQPVDFTKPIYNAVNINIKKPEVNAENKVTNPLEVNFDNGIYNAVKIDIDNPRVNTQPKQIYEYPQANEIITYDMLNIQPLELPNGAAKCEGENCKQEQKTEELSNEEVPSFFLPEANYTTLEAEKAPALEEDKTENSAAEVSFHGAAQDVKKPEIIPSVDILPNVDISVVTSNLANPDKDVQALQMEEIVRLYGTDKKLAKDFVVSDVFTNLINITKEDSSHLAPPTKKQQELRLKYFANFVAEKQDEKAKDNPPYKLTDKEKAYALQLSPLELVERNKDYALTCLGALADLFIEDYKEKEGRVIPITDTPGVSAIVDSLRKSTDTGVKLAAIDALRNIERPEYKKELEAIFTIASTDKDIVVSKSASRALAELKQIQ